MPQKPKVRCSRSTLTSASGSAGIGGVKKKDSARRCLFGKPGKKGTDTWLANSLKQIDGSRASKFNFDFENDRPMVDEDGEYVFEAVDEKEVPSFYRTKIYLPEERHRRIAPPPIAAENEVVPRIEAEEEDQHLGDYVAMNTRSRDVARNTASACMASTSAGSAASVITDGSGRSVSEAGNVRKTVGKPETKKQVSEAGVSGKRKRPMKQPIITNYMPVVRKRRVVACKMELRDETKSSKYVIMATPQGVGAIKPGISKSADTGVKGRRGGRKVAGVTMKVCAKRLRSTI